MRDNVNTRWAFATGQRERGQSLAELALTLVIVLTLLAGLVDLGRMFFIYMALRDAAQEGAVFGSLDPTNTAGIEQRVRATAQHPVDLSDTGSVQVSVSYSGDACASPNGLNGVTVTVTYNNFVLTTPFLGAVLGQQTFSISASATDTILRPPC